MITMTMVEHKRTRWAVLVSCDGYESRAEWVPLSRVTVTPTGQVALVTLRNGQTDQAPIVEVEMPPVLAVEQGFIALPGGETDGQGTLI